GDGGMYRGGGTGVAEWANTHSVVARTALVEHDGDALLDGFFLDEGFEQQAVTPAIDVEEADDRAVAQCGLPRLEAGLNLVQSNRAGENEVRHVQLLNFRN